MAQNSRDISLVIRAKNEADRTIKSVADTLGLLDTAQGKAAASAQALQNQLNKAEGSGERNANALRQVTQAVDAQAQKLATTTQQISAYKARILELTPALEKLKREAATEFVGPTQFAGNLTLAKTQIRAIEGEVRKLNTALGGTTKRPGGLESQFTAQLEGFRQTREAQRGLQGSQREIQAAIELTTTRLREQNAVLAQNRSAANSQAAVNTGFAPGLTRPQNTSADREAIAAVLRVAEARDIATQKLVRETAEQNRLNEARRIYNSIRTTVDQSGGKSAVVSADVFKVRFAAEDEATALKGAAAAHAAFEARVKSGATAMRQAEAAAAAEAAEIAHLKNVLNPAAVAEARLAAETQKLNTWLKAGTISASEHSAALKLIAADAGRAAKQLNGSQGLDSRGRPSLFGLKPYELQNLSFQINDVFTQLASGTSLTQTLAQQGGQIFQLFPKVGSAIAAGLTSAPVLGLTAALALMVVGIASAVSEAEKLRAIGGFLAANADGARVSAEALKGAARELDQYGLSAEEALTVTKQFFNEGLDEEQIVQFGRAAKDMADIMGIDLKTAAGQVAAGFRGSFEELDKLIKSTRAFTPEQREQIRLFYEQGKATEGAALAMGIFSEKMGEGADQARSEWTSAIRDLGNAWSDFAEQLGKTQLAGAVISGLESDAKNLRQLAKLFGAPQYPNRQGSPDILAAATGDGTVAPTRTATATAAQTNEAARLNEAVTARLALETKITSEAAIQTRLTALRSAEYLKIGASLTKADADAYVARVVDAERVKLAKELTIYRKQQADQAGVEAAAQQTMVAQTLRLLQREEGFISKAKFDVNAFRVGFGSDTVTRKDGRVEAVTANTNGITRADAVRDLERRIAEFVNVVKGQIGSERFNSFSPSQQAGITSVAYNYGKLPERILAAARTGTSQELARAVRGLSGDNKGINAARRNREADLIGVPNLAVEQSGAKAQQEAQDKQDKFNASIDEQIAKRTLDTTQLREQVGLQGDALIEAQKRAAVEDLIAKTIADAKKAGVDTTTAEFAARLEALRQVEQGYQDASRAREAFEVARANIDKPVSELSALRDSLRGQIDSLRTNGLSAEADALLPKLSAVNGQLREMIDNAIAAYQAMTPGTEAFPGTREELDAIISKFETLRLGTTEWVTIMGIGGQQIAQLFAATATNALDKFAQAVANGENVFGSLLDAFRQFAAEFLRQIAQMIIQQIIFNLVSGILKSVAGGAVPAGGAPFGDGSNLTGGIIRIPGLHTGGIAGRDATFTRGISPAWFTNAAHYHTGGIAGLKPDEVPAILRRGEEVLTEADPRHRANGGGGGGAPNIKIVNAIDAGDFVSKGLSTRTGEQALLNFIRANAGAVSSAMR